MTRSFNIRSERLFFATLISLPGTVLQHRAMKPSRYPDNTADKPNQGFWSMVCKSHKDHAGLALALTYPASPVVLAFQSALMFLLPMTGRRNQLRQRWQYSFARRPRQSLREPRVQAQLHLQR